MPSWSHVCRPCLARARALANAPTPTGLIASRHIIRLYSLPVKLYDPTENEHLLWYDKPTKGIEIRDYLRQWEKENQAAGSDTLPVDLPPEGDLTNSLTRTQATGAQGLITVASRDAELSMPKLGEGHHEDVTSTSDFRIPGNLVELRSAGSRIANLAIYLGSFGGCNHFYSAEGTWLISISFPTAFTVTRFISVDDLRPVLSKIPANATPEHYFEMQAKGQGPSREDGELLMDRMAIFRTDANLVYSRQIAEFESIQTIVHRSFEVEYISLVEATDRLLPLWLRNEDGSFPTHVLYAVHRALGNQEVGCSLFNSSSDCRRPDHLYEVLPPAYADNVNKVAAMVRQYVEDVMSKDRSATPQMPGNVHMLTVPLLTFVKEVRAAVMESRSRRTPSPCGILAPSSSGVELVNTAFSTTTRQVLLFLEWWSSYGFFAPGSRLHSCGALILRALDLYPDRDLGQSTAWLLLQELGIITPWELPSRYKVRLPGVSVDKNGGLSRAIPVVVEDSMRPDVAAGHRIETASKTVFCIDAASTMLIDDGISLERTEWANEFWVHIHVADPASAIKPDSELSKFVELVPENIYLPGHFEPMIPGDLGRGKPDDSTAQSLVKRFSLRDGAPSLTFSGRVNRAGDIVETKITPCTLGNVVFLEPEDVADFCDEPPPPPDTAVHSRLAVGTPNGGKSAFPPRQMSRTSDLTEAEKADLLTLYQLAEAVRQKRLSKGAWPHFFPRPSVSVGHAGSTLSPQGTRLVAADPYIEVGYDSFTGCSVVSNLMVLAGEVAARWCSSRGIPIPYRKNTKAASRFEDAYEYATEVLYPLIRRGIRPTMRQRDELQKLTGEVDMSSRPGPYFLMGLDMYTKATSPLRRFSDLLVHWQIHGALAFEREAGRSLDAAKDDLASVLPFTASGLKLPWLKMREKTARRIASGSLDWILIAVVRAWRFEGKDLGRLTFRVSSQWARGLIGRLNLFNLPARLDAEFMGGFRLLRESVIGDEYEVELQDVCVHGRTVFVKALRYLGNAQPAVVV
ncbi:hypothetical protein CP532_3410 [Ophiocordyceps camponoti-leonardi (nom. inval.)]|nr:hypothetical protein CP532_3410 [Ophiocordyceps camponoti-leonardi (nom. inval.)]